MHPIGWVDDRWSSLSHAGSVTWLAWAAWAALVLSVLAFGYLNRQLRRNRRSAAELTRPHVTMFMEPHAADWHVVELVVRNFGKTAAYDVSFSFARPPTVARYETASDGYADVVAVKLPDQLPVLAPGQEWRTVWDSAIDRAELGEAIESRFTGTISYYGSPEQPRGRWPRRAQRPAFRTRVTLDWNDLPPVRRVELLTSHDLAKQEKQKLQLLRGLLTYFHYASQQTRADDLVGEIERINLAAREVQDRLRSRAELQNDADTDTDTNITVRLGETGPESGDHPG